MKFSGRYYRVSFLGSGNVAWHLSRAMEDAGHHIDEVFGRDEKALSQLCGRLYTAEPKFDLDFSETRADVLIMAVSDAAIEELAKELVLPEQTILVHTSGSVPMKALEYAGTDHMGVLYPLQTFTKGWDISLKDIPVLIEAHLKADGKVLRDLAESIKGSVAMTNSERRKQIHLAAVFASNFTTFMLMHAEQLAVQKGFSFDLLAPLVMETIQKALKMGPEAALTGPARRGDTDTLEAHMSLLNDNEELSSLYKYLSQRILDYFFVSNRD
jgi:predicted short-subunit dehydrogenase-like oxidoreductase (DUF2520 family)